MSAASDGIARRRGAVRRPLHRGQARPDTRARRGARGRPGAHVAVITWDVSADGPCGRTQPRRTDCGRPRGLARRPPCAGRVLLSTPDHVFVRGARDRIAPWLLVGGTLALHQPSIPKPSSCNARPRAANARSCRGRSPARLAEAGICPPAPGPPNVIGVWRAPERLTRAAWRDDQDAMTDIRRSARSARRRVPRHRRQARRHSGRQRACPARRRNAYRRPRSLRPRRDAGHPRADGAASSVPARSRASGHSLFQGRRERIRRHPIACRPTAPPCASPLRHRAW